MKPISNSGETTAASRSTTHSAPGPAFSLRMPNMEPIHANCIVTPTAATPRTLPRSSSLVVTEESKTSMIRLDFSSIVLFSNIWATVKMAIHSR